MKSMHTPGPWRVMCAGNANDEHARTIRADGGAWVADVLRQGTESARASNARLIAAAPDLYAACRELLGHVDPCPDDVPMSARCRVCGMHPTKHERDCVVLTARAALAKANGEGGVA